MLALLQLTARIDAVVRWFGRAGSWLILPLIGIIMFDVITRKFQFIQQWILATPLYDWISPTKLQEMEWHLHAVIFLLAYGFGYLANSHVRVDIFREAMSRRRQAMTELLGLLVLALPFVTLICFYSYDFVLKSYLQGEGSDALTGLQHRWVIKSFAFIGLVLLLGSVLSTLVKVCVFLFGSEELARQAERNMSMFTDIGSPEIPEDERAQT